MLGSDHASTRDTVHNIGGLYTLHGQMRESEEMFKRSWTGGKTTLLGPDHISTLRTVNGLGSVY